MINCNGLTYEFEDKTTLFSNLTFNLNSEKAGLIGKNGCGKSTLLKIIAGILKPCSGNLNTDGKIGYLPQNFNSYNYTTIEEFIDVDKKLNALKSISKGCVDAKYYEIIGEHWDIEEQISSCMKQMKLEHIEFDRPIQTLSGGEKARLLLVRLLLQNPDILILDEPTNNLDSTSRKILYDFIQNFDGGILVVSHDRTLLNVLDVIFELTSKGMKKYGGNYEFYFEQKQIEKENVIQKIKTAEQKYRNTQNAVQKSREIHSQRVKMGMKVRRSKSELKSTLDRRKNSAEKTVKRLNKIAENRIEKAEKEYQKVKDAIEKDYSIFLSMKDNSLSNKKVVLKMENVSFAYDKAKPNIISNFNLEIFGNERIALIGDNGSGKTTIINLIQNKLQPQQGSITIGIDTISYLDQDVDVLNPDKTILDNLITLNPELKIEECYKIMAQFLFQNKGENILVKNLSGGEKIRAGLSCVLPSKKTTQLLILDEPTNNMDLLSIESIEKALKQYNGAMIVVSHDEYFLKNININRYIYLD